MNIKRHPYIYFQIFMLTLFCFFSCGDKSNQNIVNMLKARSTGLAYLEENKLNEAEATFKQLVEIAPDEALGYANLGLVYIRLGNFEEAEKQFKIALEKAPDDPEIHLNYAEVLMLTNRNAQAVKLFEKSIKYNPNHIRTLYKLGQKYSKAEDVQARQQAETNLKKVVEFLPQNLMAQFELIELLLREEKSNLAAGYFEKLKSQMPEFPEGADEFYHTALDLMLANEAQRALPPFNIFCNILKPTPLFQAGFDELKGTGGPLIGTPVITFRKDINISSQVQQVVMEVIQFTDATESAGLNVLNNEGNDSLKGKHSAYILAAADFDGNGTQDIYASIFDEQEKKNNQFLLSNNFGKFQDVTAKSGINHNGNDKNAIFADYDNDGYLDLFLVNNRKNYLYYHYAPQKFRDVSKVAGVSGYGKGNAACFADFDHDGDLDIFLANQSNNKFFRNNLDGTFSENSQKMAISGLDNPSKNARFGDFDDDGDIDLFVLNQNSSNVLYSNLRQGQFADVTKERGLQADTGSTAMASGDYNNDGLTDLLITKSGYPGYVLYTNKDGSVYEKDERSDNLNSILSTYNCSDVHFIDFDNDGFLDIAVAGNDRKENIEKRGILLFHNDGKGVFKEVSDLLPNIKHGGKQIVIADYNEDGDQDIFLSCENGRVYLLRNDGGNANRYLKVQLVGLRTGSGKNNYFGIGAKLEVKAGELYQSKIVTDPVTHFGLGQKTKADVVRVLWTNGVPQNLFAPGADQALLEKQILKGSCPFLYAWNGEKYEFVTDVLWRSALGMPMGIMSGETAYAFSNPSEDYFKIPGEMLKEKDGKLSIQLTDELWETAYLDQVKLLAIDHPDTSDIYVDERFTPPPFPPLHIYHLGHKKYPKSVVDDKGNDWGQVTKYKDNKYVSDFTHRKYQGITKLHDLILDLGKSAGQDNVTLYLNGWLFPTDASINVAVSQSSENLIHPTSLQVKDKNGRWQTVIENISFPMGKNKYIIIDLSDKFLSANRQVRIRASMRIYWDYIFYTDKKQDIPLKVQTLLPESADLHYRGFSRMYQKGGRYGPFWFEYSDVSTEPIWRDLEGIYTRFGDVNELLTEPDSKYIIANAGDEITVEFDASAFTDLPANWKRDYIIYTNGWLKDGDLNTATGQTVEPLPFIGMSKYPYGSDEHYPADEEHQLYMKKYNTRKVTTNNYRKLLFKN